jgi:ketosteroid isomerase-like protein
MRQLKFVLLACAWLAFGACGIAGAAEDPAHDELRAVRKEILDAITRGDFEATVRYVHPNVVVTWQNGEVVRGVKGLREFFYRVGKDAFKGYKVPPTPDELTILYGGDMGISFGHTVAQYNVFGKQFEVTSRWTATVVKENGRWLLAGYHISVNAIDNPLLNAAKQLVYWTGGAAALAGLFLGWFVGRRKKA